MKIPELTRAYLAGLIDGEAGIYITKATVKGKGRWLQPWLDISSNDEMCLRYIQSMYGGSINTVNGKAHHLRFMNSSAILKILSDVFPYLIIKKEQAKIILNFCRSRLQRRYLSYTRNELAWFDALVMMNSS